MYSRKNRAILVALLASSMLVSACQPGGPQVELGSTTEECYPQRKALADEQDYFSKSVVETAVKGAVAGAILGGITAAVTGGDVGKGILVGAVGGAVAGAGAGYWNALQEQNQNSSSLTILSSIQSDLETENKRITEFSEKFDALVECRKGQVQQVRADLAAGRITADQAATRLNELKRLYDEDIRIAREINGKMDERSKDFLFANAQVNPNGRAVRQAALSGEVEIKGVRQVLKATTGVNVRSGPGTSNAKVSSLVAGQEVTGLGQSQGWWQIDLGNGQKGWVASQFLEPVTGTRDPRPSEQAAAEVPIVDPDADPAIKIESAEEQQAADNVDQLALTNQDVRRGVDNRIETASTEINFAPTGGIQTSGGFGRQVHLG